MRMYRYTGRKRRKCPAWVICVVAAVVLVLALLTAPAAGVAL